MEINSETRIGTYILNPFSLKVIYRHIIKPTYVSKYVEHIKEAIHAIRFEQIEIMQKDSKK